MFIAIHSNVLVFCARCRFLAPELHAGALALKRLCHLQEDFFKCLEVSLSLFKSLFRGILLGVLCQAITQGGSDTRHHCLLAAAGIQPCPATGALAAYRSVLKPRRPYTAWPNASSSQGPWSCGLICSLDGRDLQEFYALFTKAIFS